MLVSSLASKPDTHWFSAMIVGEDDREGKEQPTYTSLIVDR